MGMSAPRERVIVGTQEQPFHMPQVEENSSSKPHLGETRMTKSQAPPKTSFLWGEKMPSAQTQIYCVVNGVYASWR